MRSLDNGLLGDNHTLHGLGVHGYKGLGQRYLAIDIHRLLNHRLLNHGLLNNGLLDSGVSNNLRSLDGLVVNVSFNSSLRNVFNFLFMSMLGNIFSNVLNLLIISVSLLDRLIMSLFNSLVFSDSSGHGYVLSSLLSDLFNILSFIRNLMLSDNGFIIGIGLLDRDVLDIRGGLRLRLRLNN